MDNEEKKKTQNFETFEHTQNKKEEFQSLETQKSKITVQYLYTHNRLR